MRKFPGYAILMTAGLLGLSLASPARAVGINEDIEISADSEASGGTTVNGDIRVGRRATVTGSLTTVNGSIRIEDEAVIRGAQTVNGGIKVGSGVKAEDIESVNGAVRIGENVSIDGEVTVVNGRVAIAAGSKISEDVSNVNGEIQIIAAEIAGDLSTVSGDVTLDDGANLHGDLTIEKPTGWGWDDESARKPKVVIGPGARVGGTIVAEREIELYISEKAEVGGVSGSMNMDQAIRFSGDRP